jgi:hypothetical protein
VNRKNPRIAWAGVALIATIAVTLALSGQETAPSRGRIGMVHDWSHRHVVFSNPVTVEQGMRVRQDVRFWQQYFRRNVQQAPPAAASADGDNPKDDEVLSEHEDNAFSDWFGWGRRRHRKTSARNALKRDWSMSLGPNATVGAGNFPAKFSFDISSANCGSATHPDFVAYNTSVNGSSTQASIVAFDNLYAGCGGAVPQTFWAYNTGGAVVTSVVLSLDGSQIAFVQTSASIASLVLLKWKASADGATSTTPDPISSVTASQYPTCTSPCMTTLAFSGAANDTNSSPFYDYTNDALYVGDDNGSLHKFQPVFTTGIPAELVSLGSWPATLASGFKLSSPVYDSGTRRVFVGSGSDGSSGGQLFAVDGTTGNIFEVSSQLAKGNGIASGPIVDSTAGLVYVFVGTDTGTVACNASGTSICSAVYQFSINFISGGGTETPVSEGSAAAGFPIYIGAFDNSYYASANATGSLYVCGQAQGSARLFKIPIVSGVMVPSPTLNDGIFALGSPPTNIPCSPISEIFNPNLNSGVDSGGPQGTDKIFFSAQGTDNVNGCERGGNGGCLWALPATSWQPGTVYTVGQVILDDGRGMCLQVVTTAGTSDPLNEPNWAVNPGVSTSDGTVTWTGKMCFHGVNPPQSWLPNVMFGVGFSVLDNNGNIEAASINNGMTGSTQPNWPLNIGAQTVDGAQVWVNVGPVDVATLPVPGGTSGIVVDNIVPAGTLAGGSQIYFSPLVMGFGTCGAGNGCAVQASQSKLN